jgi:hypothetical protein
LADLGEIARDLDRLLLSLRPAVVRQSGCNLQVPAHLFKKGLQRSIARASDVIIDSFPGERRRTEMPWKKRREQSLQNIGWRFLRWQLAAYAIGFCVLPPFAAQSPQPQNNAMQIPP